MRTTLNLDDDVAAQLNDHAARAGGSRSRAANELIRAGLRASRATAPVEPYDPPVVETGQPLVDITDIAGTLDLLDDRR